MAKKRWMALLAAALAFVMLFSVLYIALEADHDCEGEDCAVCAQICACAERLRHAAIALCAFAGAVSALRAAEKADGVFSRADRAISLISLKVKLSD